MGRWGLTILVGGVLHTVGAVAEVGDEGVGLGTRGVEHPCGDVGPPCLGERPRVHCEVSAHLAQHPCRMGLSTHPASTAGAHTGVVPLGLPQGALCNGEDKGGHGKEVVMRGYVAMGISMRRRHPWGRP